MKHFEKIPAYVSEIITTLKNNSYKAYIVGGSVRDLYMNKTPNDYDICTSALPEQVERIFKNKYKIIETGLRHGTVSVLCENNLVEITTFRIDGDYIDNRRPSSVSFTRNLFDDLKRRDFTINALVYSESDGLLDYFDGKNDIKNKIIKCIGNPEQRFAEDALRILRALRFSVKLDFNIEASTCAAIKKSDYLLLNIARERVFCELEQMFKCASPQRLASVLIEYRNVLEKVIKICINNHEYASVCKNVANISFDSSKRIVYYLCSIVKTQTDLIDNLSGLKASNDFKNMLIGVFEVIKINRELTSTIEAKKAVNDYGYAVCEIAAHLLADTDINRDFLLNLGIISEKNMCVSLKQLAVNGNDIKNKFGIHGKLVGKILSTILVMVIEEKVSNEKEVLLEVAKEILTKSDN